MATKPRKQEPTTELLSKHTRTLGRRTRDTCRCAALGTTVTQAKKKTVQWQDEASSAGYDAIKMRQVSGRARNNKMVGG